MLDIGPIVISVMAVPATMISMAFFRSWRSTRRNRAELCGECAGTLYVPQSFAGPSLIQGKLVCENCAAKQRRSLRRALIAAAACIGGVVGGAAVIAIVSPSSLGPFPWLVVAGVALEYTAVFGAGLAWMKRANRRAAAQLGVTLPGADYHNELQNPEV